jgi:preprotein translocase subunit YajC
MLEHSILIAIGGPPSSGGDAHPLTSMFPMVLIFLVFYFVMFRPMQTKQKKLEELVAALKPRDKVIINPGIYAEVVSLEDQTVVVRLDEKTKIRILKSAVAGLQDQPLATESK